MCTTCGCSSGAKTTLTNLETGKTSPLLDDDQAHHDHHRKHEHVHADGTRHSHAHDHDDRHHDHEHRHDHSHEHKPYRAGTVSVAELEARVLQKNDKLAAVNRAWFAGREILALNIVSSPGAGRRRYWKELSEI